MDTASNYPTPTATDEFQSNHLSLLRQAPPILRSTQETTSPPKLANLRLFILSVASISSSSSRTSYGIRTHPESLGLRVFRDAKHVVAPQLYGRSYSLAIVSFISSLCSNLSSSPGMLPMLPSPRQGHTRRATTHGSSSTDSTNIRVAIPPRH